MNKYWIVHFLLSWIQFNQVIILNKVNGLLGTKSKLLKNIKSVQNTSNAISRFCKMQFTVKSDNLTNLWHLMSVSDKTHFDFNLASLDWNQFFYTQCRGCRVYLMNDPLSTVPNAQRNRSRMKTYKILISLVLIFMSYLMYRFILKVY